MKRLLLFLLFIPFVVADCVEPSDGMIIRESTTFCSSTFDVLNGITIAADNVVLDCSTGILRGVVGQSEIGVRVENVDGITIKNCNIVTFNQGLYLKNVTNSLIEDNAFLKNRIGIRLLDSFENVIRDNSDKSFQVAVSAINSKFNTVMLGNKEIERAFCEENACNEHRDMTVCVAGDFYCSRKCSVQTDSDCGPVVKEEPVKEPVKSAEEIIEEIEESVVLNDSVVEKPAVVEKDSLPFVTKLFIYVVLYGIAFVVLVLARKHKMKF